MKILNSSPIAYLCSRAETRARNRARELSVVVDVVRPFWSIKRRMNSHRAAKLDEAAEEGQQQHSAVCAQRERKYWIVLWMRCDMNNSTPYTTTVWNEKLITSGLWRMFKMSGRFSCRDRRRAGIESFRVLLSLRCCCCVCFCFLCALVRVFILDVELGKAGGVLMRSTSKVVDKIVKLLEEECACEWMDF